MKNEIIYLIGAHPLLVVLVLTIFLDTILGCGRAIKERKFNSCVGIDGAIRKVLMVVCVAFMLLIGSVMDFDFLFMIPDEYMQFIGIEKMGICEMFSLMFILFEAVSILKNMHLCGLPIPGRIKNIIEKFLKEMTEELPAEDNILINEKKGENYA